MSDETPPKKVAAKKAAKAVSAKKTASLPKGSIAPQPTSKLERNLRILDWLINAGLKVLAAFVAMGVFVAGFVLLWKFPASVSLAAYQTIITFGFAYVMRHYFPSGKGSVFPFDRKK